MREQKKQAVWGGESVFSLFLSGPTHRLSHPPVRALARSFVLVGVQLPYRLEFPVSVLAPTMYFLAEFEDNIQVKPEHCGPNFQAHVQDTLRQKVEGTVSEERGHVLKVLAETWRGLAKCQDGTGQLLVPIWYHALTFKATKDDVLDCEVSEVNKLGFFGECGPLRIFVSKSSMHTSYEFHDAQGGNAPSYISQDIGESIVPGTALRIRLLGVRYEAAQMFAIGTINDDWLGPAGDTDEQDA